MEKKTEALVSFSTFIVLNLHGSQSTFVLTFTNEKLISVHV